MKVFNNIVMVLLFMAFIFFFGLKIWFTPDKSTSYFENRSLTTRPSVQVNTILNGDFMKSFDKYVTDQFYLRDDWVRGYLKWQRLTNQSQIYKYFIADDDWVYPTPINYMAPGSIKESTNRLTKLNHFTKENNIDLFFFFLPDRKLTLDIDYPKWIVNLGEENKALFASELPKDHFHYVDVAAEWKKKWTQKDLRKFYFMTDHHWNINGALAGYEVIHNTFNTQLTGFDEDPFTKNNFVESCITNKTFMGSYNKQLYGMVNPSREKMCYFFPKNVDISSWKVYKGNPSTQRSVPFSSVYGSAKASPSPIVDYGQVYSTDLREITIINPAKAKGKMKALFIKDSYGNPLLPLLANDFYQTTFYDVRYNSDRNLYDYIKENNFDVVAFLYNDSTIFSAMYQFEPDDKTNSTPETNY